MSPQGLQMCTTATEILAPKGSSQNTTESLHPPNNPLPGRCNLSLISRDKRETGLEIQCHLKTDTTFRGGSLGPGWVFEVLGVNRAQAWKGTIIT